MSVPVSQYTEQALRAAMNRLLAGSAVRSDGRLTVVNLAIEAGVSRATANRAAAVLAEFRRATGERRGRGQPEEVARLGEAEERLNAHVLAQHAQARALHQRQAQQHAARAQLLSFRRRNDDDDDKNNR